MSDPGSAARQLLSLRRLRWIALTAALAVTAVFGGLRSADHVAAVDFGQTFDDGPLLITPHSARVTDAVAGLGEASDGCRFVVLEATVANRADRAVDFPSAYEASTGRFPCLDVTDHRDIPYAVGLVGIPSTFAGAVRARDRQPYPAVEPGFTEDFAIAWMIRAADVPQHPTVSVLLPDLERYVSTLIVDERWGADTDRFGRLEITLDGT